MEMEMEMGVEALEASCIVGPPKEDDPGGQGVSKRSGRWRQRIRTTFPLIFTRRCQRTVSEVIPEADAEENPPVKGKPASEPEESRIRRADGSGAVERPGPGPEPGPKEKKNPQTDMTEPPSREDENSNLDPKQVRAVGDKPHAHGPQSRSQNQNQSRSRSRSRESPQSALQVLGSAWRKMFSRGSGAAVEMRPRSEAPRRRRPASEGALSFGSLFCVSQTTVDGRAAGPRPDPRAARWASIGADPWGEGRDLPSLLQQVSIRGRRESDGVLEESRRARRELDLFSSLRLKRRKESEGGGGGEEERGDIRTLVTNLRNKTSARRGVDELSSSEDEDENSTPGLELHPEKKQKEGEDKEERKRVAARQAKQEQLKRLHRAQAIQRQLEEVGEKQHQIEERGVQIEKILRGETEPLTPEDGDEAELYQTWFKLVLEKNRLARYESELMVFARELELEDTQSRLQQDLRRRLELDDSKKSASELQEEQEILAQIMRAVEERDTLVSVLEEQRVRERAEDEDLESLLLCRGYQFHWGRDLCAQD